MEPLLAITVGAEVTIRAIQGAITHTMAMAMAGIRARSVATDQYIRHVVEAIGSPISSVVEQATAPHHTISGRGTAVKAITGTLVNVQCTPSENAWISSSRRFSIHHYCC